jgi:hypothetical protein
MYKLKTIRDMDLALRYLVSLRDNGNFSFQPGINK